MGMIVSMWISFAPKPPSMPLPTFINGCELYTNNQTVLYSKVLSQKEIGLRHTNFSKDFSYNLKFVF